MLQKSKKIVTKLNQKIKEQNKKPFDKSINPLKRKPGEKIPIENRTI